MRSGVAKVGNTSFTIVAEVLDGETVAATAQVVLVGFDPKTQRAAPLSGSQRAALIKECESI